LPKKGFAEKERKVLSDTSLALLSISSNSLAQSIEYSWGSPSSSFLVLRLSCMALN
jgi:hypothetical protein